jgi:hypothetical protein
MTPLRQHNQPVGRRSYEPLPRGEYRGGDIKRRACDPEEVVAQRMAESKESKEKGQTPLILKDKFPKRAGIKGV